MARTKDVKELVRHHVRTDKRFAEALLREGIDALLSGDVDGILLLTGGTKKRQQSDIETAHGYWRDYKRRARERR